MHSPHTRGCAALSMVCDGHALCLRMLLLCGAFILLSLSSGTAQRASLAGGARRVGVGLAAFEARRRRSDRRHARGVGAFAVRGLLANFPVSGWWCSVCQVIWVAKNPSPGQDGGYTASRATILLGNVVRAPHARARASHWSMGCYNNYLIITLIGLYRQRHECMLIGQSG